MTLTVSYRFDGFYFFVIVVVNASPMLVISLPCLHSEAAPVFSFQLQVSHITSWMEASLLANRSQSSDKHPAYCLYLLLFFLSGHTGRNVGSSFPDQR